MKAKLGSAESRDLASKRYLELKNDIPEGRRGQIEAKLEKMPKGARYGYLRATLRKTSAKTAIKAHCLECCGYVREEVAKCSAKACTLWQLRPYQPKPAKA